MSATPASPAPNADPAGQETLVNDRMQAASRIRELGEFGLPTIYSAVSVQHSGLRLDITGASAAEQFTRLAPGIDVEIRVVPGSFASREKLRLQVMADWEGWRTSGVLITAVGERAASNEMRVGIERLTTAATEALHARYGQALIVEEEASAVSTSVTADSSPWKGGLRLTSGTICTGGFGTHLGTPAAHSTGPYMITAGHCFAPGSTVYNGAGSFTVGTFSRNGSIYFSGGMDIALVNTTSGGSIYELSNTRTQSDGTRIFPTMFASLCRSGAAIEKACGTVIELNQCRFYGPPINLNFCHLVDAVGGPPLTAPGDSGGPWYNSYDNGISRAFQAAGIQSGAEPSSGSSCTTLLGANQTCYSEAYFTDLAYAFATGYGYSNMAVNY